LGACGGAEDADAEELDEEDAEDVRGRGRHDDDGDEGGHRAVEDGGAREAQRVVGALLVRVRVRVRAKVRVRVRARARVRVRVRVRLRVRVRVRV